MRGPIFKNREFKVLITAVAITCLMFQALMLIQTQYVWYTFNTELTKRNIALLGNLLEIYPEGLSSKAEVLVIQAFTREASAEDVQRGQALASGYGYTVDLPLNSTPLLSKWYTWSFTASVGLGLALLLALFITIYIISDRNYRRLREYTLGAERLMGGDYDFHFPENTEGELAILGFQFNQLSQRLKLAFATLQGEKKLMQEMISGISHQLKTPLASSRIFTELMLDGAVDNPETRQEFLCKNLTQLERMEWLIQSLLKMSRLEAGVIEFNKTNSDLVMTMKDVISSLTDKLKENGQILDVRGGKDPILILHDPKWLKEAMANTIDNAIRHTPKGTRIKVSLEKTDSTVMITVSDTGPGIPKEELHRIFERFYQGSHSGEASSKGSGIGLSLAKLIIEKHGGIIQARSTLGEGTTFIISLPRSWLS